MTKAQTHKMHMYLGIILGAAALAMVGFFVANPDLFKGELLFLETEKFRPALYVMTDRDSLPRSTQETVAIAAKEEVRGQGVFIGRDVYILYTYENGRDNLIVKRLNEAEEGSSWIDDNATLTLDLPSLKPMTDSNLRVYTYTCKTDENNFCDNKNWRYLDYWITN